MHNDVRIIEILSQSLKKQEEMVEKLSALEKQQNTTNIEVREVLYTVMRIAEQVEKMSDYDDRLKALEKAVFKD